MGTPRWSDDPTYVLGVLTTYLRPEDPDLAPLQARPASLSCTDRCWWQEF
ncbi:MAG: hypothetical protein WBV74_14570 [Pseudonocardiaceae bacterium]